jgi:hypothetical protein
MRVAVMSPQMLPKSQPIRGNKRGKGRREDEGGDGALVPAPKMGQGRFDTDPISVAERNARAGFELSLSGRLTSRTR